MEIEYTWMARDVSGVALYESRPTFSRGYWRCDKGEPLRWRRVKDVLFIEPGQLWERLCVSTTATDVGREDYALWGGYWWHLSEINDTPTNPRPEGCTTIVRGGFKTPVDFQSDDAVNHPDHYKRFGKEVIDIIRDTLSREEFEGYCKGNELKYRLRAGFKGDANEDIRKALKYEEFRAAAKKLDGMENIMPRNAEEW